MTDKEALLAFAQKKAVDQTTIKRLLRSGLIEAQNVTNMDTPQGVEEYLPTFITAKGKKVIES